jgi:hypothetical protein
VLEQIDRLLELVHGTPAVAVEHRRLAQRMRQRGHRLGLACLRGDAGQRGRARPGARLIAAFGERRHRPAQRRDREVAILTGPPAIEQQVAAHLHLIAGRLAHRRDHGEPPRTDELGRGQLDPASQRRGVQQLRPSRIDVPSQGMDDPQVAARRRAGVRGRGG